MHIGSVLFDVDGTLLDTTEFILSAYEHALGALELPVPDRETLSRTVGIPLDENYDNLAPGHTEEAMELHRAYQRERVASVPAFPGAVEVLTMLKDAGIPVAAVTSRSNRTSVKTLEAARIDHLLGAIVSAEDAPALKPDPAPLRRAHELLGSPAGPVVMVGDAHQDIEAGKAFNATTVAATYGFHGRAVLDTNPDYVIDAISDLPAVLDIRS